MLERNAAMEFLSHPNIVALEVTNHCQMRCVHCPHGHDLIRKKGLMDMDLFRSVIDDIDAWKREAPRLPEIVLYGNGEPLLHKKLPDMVRYVKERGFNVNLSSNVQLASPEKAAALSDAGLDLIKLSFWGDDKAEYEQRAKRHDFDETIEKAKAFIAAASPDMEVLINIVKFRTPGAALDPSPEFMRHFEGFPNVRFYCFFASDWRGTLDLPELKAPLIGEPQKKPCKMAAEMVPISVEGQVVFCWIDYNREWVLGNYRPGSLLDFWRSDERLSRLEMQAEGRFPEMELCKGCSAPYTEAAKERYYRKSGEDAIRVRGRHVYDPDFFEHVVDGPEARDAAAAR